MTATTQLLQLAPGDILLDANVRRAVSLGAEFTDSIKTFGVQVPVMVYPPVKGKYTIFDGQRRVLAAADLKLDSVPAIIIDPAAGDAERIFRQISVNEDREGLVDADMTRAFLDLEEAGVPADEIAAKTHTKPDVVKVALGVAKSAPAAAAITTFQLTLSEAAAFAEFDDNPADVAALEEAVKTDRARLSHHASTIRTRRAQQAARDLARKKIPTSVKEIPLEEFDAEGSTARQLDRLYVAGQGYTRIAPADHKSCPGHAALADFSWDWQGNDRVFKPVVTYVCTDWKANGHSDGAHGSSKPGGGLSDEEKAKRKTTRDNNKLWMPATVVRLEFIREMLQRKELPSGWELFVAQFIAREGGNDYRTRDLVINLLNGGSKRHVEWVKDNPTRAPQFLIAAAIAAIEGIYEYSKKGWEHTLSPSYLTQLSKWGYTLSDIEETVGKKAGK